ncbi:UDP-N-acetylmuramate dehydrogenase [Dokdonia sp. Hel_I_53]|uniref:UDP-N-acetylmuramate dehydrogenase n=1 Tax=Dokdonia sp. Hel_I_53 TaxID=1566287 RepID=UPI00119B798B|nr:UDP-N-acetylmuramate dehydrogenase [Dokdonia sp. Hel_I_53]TVZ52084.1 UDP-N-acetylmuramate dehydrogenase [Dokdonia sp. Hel_I_53]
MLVLENASLKEYNTFGIAAKARFFASISTVDDLLSLLRDDRFTAPFIIGGGSNMLLTENVDKLVIHINNKGIEVVDDNFSDSEILLKVAAGENWHEFVLYCVRNNFGGVENLSLIPGNVGTSPIQNIGAYGVELKDTFFECTAIHRKTFKEKIFSLEECNFGYRDSVFKNDLKDEYIITSVTFRLTKKDHILQTDYGAIGDTLKEKNITTPTLKEISQAVIEIRQSKLPDPNKIGNSGSFFKNPIISQEAFTALRKLHKDIPYYPIGNDLIKVPAGWLIEQSGFKGKRYGDAGVHDKQALVLVNYGNATGDEIWDVAMKVKNGVKDKFGIAIEPEVNVI